MEHKLIGEMVADDYRLAAVLRKYKIDFCCKGNRTLEEACADKKIDSEKVWEEMLTAGNAKKADAINFKAWPLDLLIDYIEKKHHRYVEQESIVLSKYLDKLVHVHGPEHPELSEIRRLFYECASELAAHMKKEELMLFPYIRKMVQAERTQQELKHAHFGTVENPVQMMMQEHIAEGERFVKIAGLSNNYTPPQDACNTYRVTYALLQEFEKDLHEHIHLENNILFPAAMRLEKELNAATA